MRFVIFKYYMFSMKIQLLPKTKMDLRYKILITLLIFVYSTYSQNLKVVFRYDDYRLQTSSLDEAVVNVFQKNNIPLVLGVIPCDSTEKLLFGNNYTFLPELKKYVTNGSVEIALHGLTHLKLLKGEFGKVDAKEQFRRIYKGKSLLDSIFKISVQTFIPPWNAYDDITLNQLQKEKFTSISSGLWFDQSFSNSSINYFPETNLDFNTLLPTLIENKNRSGIVVFMFHAYDFNSNFSLVKLDSLLRNIVNNKNVKCVTFQQLSTTHEESDKKRMKANLESNMITKFTHLNGVIYTTNFQICIRILNLVLYLALSIVLFFLSGLFLFKNSKISSGIIFYILIIFFVYVGLSVWFHLMTPLKLIIFISIISLFMPIIIKLSFKKTIQ